MNNPIKLTENAIKKIMELTDKSNKFALRLDLKKGGCAGMEYFMEYVDKVEINEEVIDFVIPLKYEKIGHKKSGVNPAFQCRN